MRNRLILGIALFAGINATSAQAQKTAKADTAGYSSKESDFTVGRKVYLRSTHTLIGTITAADTNHSFKKHQAARRRMSAVLITRKDGPKSWEPVEGISRVYVVR